MMANKPGAHGVPHESEIDIPGMVEKITLFRTARSLTRHKFCKQYGISPTTLVRLQAGKGCSVGTLNKVAIALRCPILDLLRPSPLNVADHSKIIRFYHRFKEFTRLPEDVQDLLAFLVGKILDSKEK